jgi:hypothetical protein
MGENQNINSTNNLSDQDSSHTKTWVNTKFDQQVVYLPNKFNSIEKSRKLFLSILIITFILILYLLIFFEIDFKIIILLTILFIFIVSWIPTTKIKSRTKAALEFLKKCPEAVEFLGEPIKASIFYSYGLESSKDFAFGNAFWKMKVYGSKNSGIYKFAMIRFGSDWKFLGGTLEINDKIIDIGKCIGVDADILKSMQENFNIDTEKITREAITEALRKNGFPEEEIKKIEDQFKNQINQKVNELNNKS